MINNSRLFPCNNPEKLFIFHLARENISDYSLICFPDEINFTLDKHLHSPHGIPKRNSNAIT